MTTQETIAILGATGATGSDIAKRLAKSPYRLLLMSESAQDLNKLQKNISNDSQTTSEIISIHCAKEASWEADIIIVATTSETLTEVADKIRDVAVGKIVISMLGPLSNSHDGVLAALDSNAAEELKRLLPFSTIADTFNYHVR